MTRYIPAFILIIVCLIAFALYLFGTYPFSDPTFSFDGYDLHVFGGIGYAALQILIVQLCFPQLRFTQRFFVVQGLGITAFLLALELLQYDDPYREVQLGDIVAQTCGAVIALLILWFAEKRWERTITH